MTDFHRSLDRAIARDEQDPHTDWGLADVRPLIDEINEDIAAMVAVLDDNDLPGMWTASDFTGGDPDERSYVQRGWITEDDIAEGAGFKRIMEEPVAYDGFGAPLYAHQLASDEIPVAPDHVFPLRFIAGVDPADIDLQAIKLDVIWQIPEPMTVRTIPFGPVGLEVIELLTGLPFIPLCDRQLPAEGQE